VVFANSGDTTTIDANTNDELHIPYSFITALKEATKSPKKYDLLINPIASNKSDVQPPDDWYVIKGSIGYYQLNVSETRAPIDFVDGFNHKDIDWYMIVHPDETLESDGYYHARVEVQINDSIVPYIDSNYSNVTFSVYVRGSVSSSNKIIVKPYIRYTYEVETGGGGGGGCPKVLVWDPIQRRYLVINNVLQYSMPRNGIIKDALPLPILNMNFPFNKIYKIRIAENEYTIDYINDIKLGLISIDSDSPIIIGTDPDGKAYIINLDFKKHVLMPSNTIYKILDNDPLHYVVKSNKPLTLTFTLTTKSKELYLLLHTSQSSINVYPDVSPSWEPPGIKSILWVTVSSEKMLRTYEVIRRDYMSYTIINITEFKDADNLKIHIKTNNQNILIDALYLLTPPAITPINNKHIIMLKPITIMHNSKGIQSGFPLTIKPGEFIDVKFIMPNALINNANKKYIPILFIEGRYNIIQTQSIIYANTIFGNELVINDTNEGEWILVNVTTSIENDNLLHIWVGVIAYFTDYRDELNLDSAVFGIKIGEIIDRDIYIGRNEYYSPPDVPHSIEKYLHKFRKINDMFSQHLKTENKYMLNNKTISKDVTIVDYYSKVYTIQLWVVGASEEYGCIKPKFIMQTVLTGYRVINGTDAEKYPLYGVFVTINGTTLAGNAKILFEAVSQYNNMNATPVPPSSTVEILREYREYITRLSSQQVLTYITIGLSAISLVPGIGDLAIAVGTISLGFSIGSLWISDEFTNPLILYGSEIRGPTDGSWKELRIVFDENDQAPTSIIVNSQFSINTPDPGSTSYKFIISINAMTYIEGYPYTGEPLNVSVVIDPS